MDNNRLSVENTYSRDAEKVILTNKIPEEECDFIGSFYGDLSNDIEEMEWPIEEAHSTCCGEIRRRIQHQDRNSQNGDSGEEMIKFYDIGKETYGYKELICIEGDRKLSTVSMVNESKGGARLGSVEECKRRNVDSVESNSNKRLRSESIGTQSYGVFKQFFVNNTMFV